jgi:hypothetical protein
MTLLNAVSIDAKLIVLAWLSTLRCCHESISTWTSWATYIRRKRHNLRDNRLRSISMRYLMYSFMSVNFTGNRCDIYWLATT